MCFLLSIVAHGALLSLWITTTYQPNVRQLDEQIARPSAVISQQLPHWRATVDCSTFNVDCMVHGRTTNRYRKYPFPPSGDVDDFHVTKLTEIPARWIDTYKSPIHNNLTRNENHIDSMYIYPDKASSNKR